MIKLFFDTEFTGLKKDTTLISIGIVAEDGRWFYAEFTDYDRKSCDDWIQENVIQNLISKGKITKNLVQTAVGNAIYSVQMCDTTDNIRKELTTWLESFGEHELQFISDVSHYDFVLLLDIFGGAFSLPKNVSPACHDINQDLARRFNMTEKEAFDLNRENVVSNFSSKMPDGKKHNSLFDARVIKLLYEICNH